MSGLPEIMARFWSKVDPCRTDGCMVWTAGLLRDGYGQFHPERSQTKRAHRWIWEQVNGAIPEGMHLDHLCRNRTCVNLDDLEIVTHQENMARGIFGVLTTHCPKGHPYDAENTYRNKGHRYCRKCHTESQRRRLAGA